MPSIDPKPVKINYDEYLSYESVHRVRSELKALRPYFELPGMISFGGGYPHPSTWPINGMTLSVPFAKSSAFVPGYGVSTPEQLLPQAPYTAPLKGEALSSHLSTELQYGSPYGAHHFVKWLKEHVRRIHNPPNENWDVLNTAGNTDAVDGIFRTLCNRGDSLLVEEFAYPGTLTTAETMGISCVGVTMDNDGIDPTALDEVMENWDEEKRGSRKPRMVLMVPTCSNPTGSTTPEYRKRELYAVCRKHSLLIVEDDPYCFLQIRPNGADSPIIPTFLSMDVDGRVLRLDSFSKIVAPGSRCGWLTGPTELVSRVMMRSECSTQCPSGFSIAAISTVLRAWGSHEGFENNYLPYISNIYKERCLFMINLFEKYLPKSTCEWPEGSGGMFLWVRLKTEAHPEITTLSPEDISNRVFKQAIDERVLLAQSRYFKSAGGKEWTKEEEAKRIYLRLCFANPTLEDMEEGVQRFARALKREFKLE